MLSLSWVDPEKSRGLVLPRSVATFFSSRMISVFRLTFGAWPQRLTSSHGASLSATWLTNGLALGVGSMIGERSSSSLVNRAKRFMPAVDTILGTRDITAGLKVSCEPVTGWWSTSVIRRDVR